MNVDLSLEIGLAEINAENTRDYNALLDIQVKEIEKLLEKQRDTDVDGSSLPKKKKKLSLAMQPKRKTSYHVIMCL